MVLPISPDCTEPVRSARCLLSAYLMMYRYRPIAPSMQCWIGMHWSNEEDENEAKHTAQHYLKVPNLMTYGALTTKVSFYSETKNIVILSL